ncbi:hypothetical protein Tco_1469955, partial [Tanacetum coccineum]
EVEVVQETFFDKEEPVNSQDEGEKLSEISAWFTPSTEKDEVSINEVAGNNFHNIADENKDNRENLNDVFCSSHVNSNKKEVGNDSSSLEHFKKSECPRTDGSILGLLEEVVKVDSNVYNMESGAISNMGEIISSKGVEEVGQGAEKDIRSRSNIILKLQECEEIDLLEMAQKAKIK